VWPNGNKPGQIVSALFQLPFKVISFRLVFGGMLFAWSLGDRRRFDAMKEIGIAIIAQAVFILGVLSMSYASTGSPEVKTYQGISYVSGGIGMEEREAVRAMGKKDDLELSFALQNKNYLGGAKVLIRDEKGKTILDATADGPLFFAELPEGNYNVTATALGNTLEQKAHVSAKAHARLHFTWTESNHETATRSLTKK
jgi:hypothetical protein